MDNPLSKNRRRVTLVNSILILAIAGGGLWTYRNVNGAAAADSTTARTTRVLLTDVTSTVSATGTVTDPAEVGVNFATSGTLTSVRVEPGDKVKRGEVLASIDSTQLRNALNQSSANVDQSAASLASAKTSLAVANATLAEAEAALLPSSSNMIAAEQSLLQAKQAYNNATTEAVNSDANLTTLKQAWDNAKTTLASLTSKNTLNSATYDQLVSQKYNAITEANTAYSSALSIFQTTYTAATANGVTNCALEATAAAQSSCSTALTNLQTLYNRVTDAQTAYNLQVSTRALNLDTDATTVKNAELAVTNAEAAYTRAKNAAELNRDVAKQIADKALNLAQVKYDDTVAALKKTVTTATNTVTSARNNVNQAQASLSIAKANRAQSADNLAAATLRAPVAGTVASISGSVGQLVAAGSAAGSGSTSTSTSGFIVLTGVSTLRVEASVTEGDAGAVQVGQPVTFEFDALDGATADGSVSWIDLTGTSGGSVVTYGITLDLTKVPTGLKPGMSAQVTITTASASGVLALPASAITTNGSRTLVNVVTTDAEGVRTTTRTEVTVGLKGDSLTEILSGLKEGDEVAISSTTSGATSAFPGGGIPGSGMGLGGGSSSLTRAMPR